MLSIGFDQTFIDTLVRVEDKNGNLIDKLPEPGNHHKTAIVDRIAGGNSTNTSFILNKLNITHKLVVPTNKEFEYLLQKRGINNYINISGGVNETVALTWKPGEVQFNYVSNPLGKSNWNDMVQSLWVESDINVFLNWGLNPKSPEWISMQMLSISGWHCNEIMELEDLVHTALKEDFLPRNNIIIDPGSIQHHNDKPLIVNLLNKIGNEAKDIDYCILCTNENESKEFKDIIFPIKIIHTATEVVMENNSNTIIQSVPKLPAEPLTFVGAGDAFLAGIIKSCVDNNLDNNLGNLGNLAIIVAQKFLLGQLN